MTTYLRIKNYEKYQHFKRRGSLPWIRLYTSILDDDEFAGWTDSQLLNWIKLILFASRKIVPVYCGKCVHCSGKTPSFTHQSLVNDSSFFRHKLGANNRFNLDFYINKGFLVKTDNKLISKCCPIKTEVERQKDIKTEISLQPEIPKLEPRKTNPAFVDTNLAQYFRNRLNAIKPGIQLRGTEAEWAEALARIRITRKRPHDHLAKVIDFALDHHFWFKNILHPEKLDEHLDRLELEMRDETPTNELDDWLKRKQEKELA